jgi:hypothetical protein
MLCYPAESLLAENDALRARVAELERLAAQQSAQRAEAALREREQELGALQETALVLMEHLDVTAALQAIITRAAQLAGTQHGFVYRVNQPEHVLETRVGIGIHDSFVGFRIGYGEGIAGRVWQSGAPLVVYDYASWPGRAPNAQITIFVTIVAVPLIARGEEIGVIGLSYADRPRGSGAVRRQAHREEPRCLLGPWRARPRRRPAAGRTLDQDALSGRRRRPHRCL